MLFVGTDEPLPLKEFRKEALEICVQPIGENEAAVRAHFSKPIVQYVGSTSGCGCDFPHWLLHNGEEPNHVPEAVASGRDPGRAASDEHNRQALVKLLERGSRGLIELYGVWDGNWSEAPIRTEEISVKRMHEKSFRLGEQVFYRVQL
jgi:hypothetical protein